MAVSRMDEFLAHQTPHTFDQVFTSDRNFYDRHYFNAHHCTDELFLVVGLGLYPNLGVMDAFATASMGEVQHTVRALCELGVDRLDSRVGPLAVEVLEPLASLRVVCERTQWPLAFDLTWRSATEPYEEPRVVRRRGPWVLSDTSRYTQAGTWQGSMEIDGQSFDLSSGGWWGSRDHSWGVRPVGEPEPPGIHAKSGLRRRGTYHHWIPMQFDDFMIMVMLDEDSEGTRLEERAVKVGRFGTQLGGQDLGAPELRVSWFEGTREIERAEVTFPGGAGAGGRVRITPLRTAFLSVGSGYFDDGYWGHGRYQGELVVEGVSHPIAAPEDRQPISGLNQTLSRFELEDGPTGYGVHENMCLGEHLPSGFTADDDPALA